MPPTRRSACGCSADDKVVEGMTVHTDRGGLFGGKIAGANAIYLYIMLGPFGGHISGKHFQTTFRGRISRHGVTPQFAHHRTDVNYFSGFAGYHLGWFILLSILTRGARFFIVALLMSQFGPRIKSIIDNHFNLVATLAIVAFVGGFVAFRYLF